jgi:hypothetical protein
MDAFTLSLAAIVGAAALLIVRAVRQTRAQIDRHLQGTDPRRRQDIARDLAARIREQAERVKCVHCGGPSIMLLGTVTRYRCEACESIFDGPPHMPDPAP